MMNSFRKWVTYLLLHLIVATIVCFLLKLFIFEWGALKNVKNFKVLLSTTIWLCILLGVIFFFLKSAGLNYKKAFSFCVIVGLTIIGINIIIIFLPNSFRFQILNADYVGIYGFDEYEDDEGNIQTTHVPFYVYHNRDEDIQEKIRSIQEEHGDASEEKFIFWQTAYAAGYDPKYINQFNTNEGSPKFELIITTGLLVLVECFINCLTLAIFYLVVPLISMAFKRPFLFKDYTHLKEVIDRQPA